MVTHTVWQNGQGSQSVPEWYAVITFTVIAREFLINYIFQLRMHDRYGE